MKKATGSAILTAVGAGFVLLILIAGLQSFSSHRVRVTDQETRNFMALCIAEAGLNAVITELRANFGFRTHEVKPDMTWDSVECDNTPTLKDDNADPHKFSITPSTKGTLKGTLGNGQFKVRCGQIKAKDDPTTQNIDESQCYFKVESLGRVGDTVRKIEAVLQRRFLGREFLMYDGDTLSLVFGLSNDTDGFNVFGKGHLYGHNAVEIGRIVRQCDASCNGTDQRLEDIEMIRCGIGGIFLYTPIKMSFRKNERLNLPEIPLKAFGPNQTFAGGYTYPQGKKEYGEIPKELEGIKPDIPPEIASYVTDGKTPNNEITIPEIPLSLYKTLAQKTGGMVSGTAVQYKLPSGFPPVKRLSATGDDEVIVLDFGNKSPYLTRNPTGIPAVQDGGVIYSEKSLVIKGNPEKNIKIVSEGNIYVCGDFNQSGDFSKPEDLYGLSQKYNGDPEKSENYDYKDDIKNRLKGDTSGVLHKTIEVIANE